MQRVPVPEPDVEPADRLVEALLEGDRSRAEDLLVATLEDRDGLADLVDGVVQPAMQAIGDGWADGEISVADEQLATATLQSALAQVYRRARADRPGPRRILLACVAGNEHAVGLRGLADTLELAGWTVRYLGPDVPPNALADHADEWSPDVVALSVALEEHLEAAEAAIDRLRKLDDPPEVLLGGRVGSADWAREVGADIWAPTAHDALRALA